MTNTTTTLPDLDAFEQLDATEIAQQLDVQDGEDATDTSEEVGGRYEEYIGPGAAYAAAMDLVTTGAHVHYYGSGETECLTGDCRFAVAGQLLDGVV